MIGLVVREMEWNSDYADLAGLTVYDYLNTKNKIRNTKHHPTVHCILYTKNYILHFAQHDKRRGCFVF